MVKSPRNLRLDEALALPGCPVCRVVLQRVAQTLESMQDELVLDPGWRERVDAAWGFCTLHAQQWLTEAQPLSTAIIYEVVLARVSRELERATPGRNGSLRSRLRSSRESAVRAPVNACALCETRDEQERLLTAQLIEDMHRPPFQARYAQSDGLCLAHLNLALGSGADAAMLEMLRTKMLETNTQLRAQLREVIRKHDYRFRDEPAGDEWKAVEQSVRRVASDPGIDGK